MSPLENVVLTFHANCLRKKITISAKNKKNISKGRCWNFYTEHSHGWRVPWEFLLTHLSLASHKMDIGKQCRPRSDAAFCTVCIKSRNFYKNMVTIQINITPLLLEMDLSRVLRQKSPLGTDGLMTMLILCLVQASVTKLYSNKILTSAVSQ